MLTNPRTSQPNCVRPPVHETSLSSPRWLGFLYVSALALSFCALPSTVQGQTTYLGFDRNEYPGDDAMKLLRKDFAFTGYWLGPPPGEKSDSWQGKREYLRSLGYGFLLLYSGPDSSLLKSPRDSTQRGTSDAKKAAAAARQEGFPHRSIIFADIEEGGRLTPNYHAYLRAWSDELRRSGFLPGAYCSAIPVNEGHGVTITTADDIYNDPLIPDFARWVYNDACVPSPGCAPGQPPPPPSKSGASYADVWQFAQSPRRKEFAARCPGYAPDKNCYASGDTARRWHLDLNSATSPDPSRGAK